jgi:hypothetical protein
MAQVVEISEVEAPVDGRVWGVSRVEVETLKPGPIVRLGGIKRDYLQVLIEAKGDFPPVLVRRQDNAIVDGHYRWLAARELGHSHIDCLYFDGSADSALVEALRRNLHQGLPLSLRERATAGRRVLGLFPEWSDRRLGEVCGLSAGKIGQLRAEISCSADENGHLNSRRGRDGKRYPADPLASRARIVSALQEDPDRSLRRIAQATDTSPATVRAVKSTLGQFACAETSPGPVAEPQAPQAMSSSHLNTLTDAALVSTEEGAAFAVWFERTAIAEEWQEFVESIPVSRIYEITDEARRRALRWSEFAETLEARTRRPRAHLHV